MYSQYYRYIDGRKEELLRLGEL